MNLFDLSGRVAIVTGGNGGIGLGIATGLLEHGASVTVAGRNPDKIGAAVQALDEVGAGWTGSGQPPAALGVQTDVTDEAQVNRLVERTVERFGRLDIMVANAGIGIRHRPEEYTLEEFNTVVATDLTAVFLCCKAAYPEMKKIGGGKVITIGSMTSIFGHSFALPYAASKGGVVQLTKSLAISWAPENIQANCILPGWIDTELTQGARRYFPELYDKILARTPADRWGVPADLAGTAVFLASRASDFVTGVSIPIDGGYAVQMP